MELNKLFEVNDEGNDYVVGDLHGCFDLLERELYEISFDKKVDRLFSVGDLVDRGAKNLECLRLIAEDWFHPVQGNHEDMMLKAILDRKNIDHWLINGGDWFMRLTQEESKEVTQLCEVIRQTVPYSIIVKTKTGDVGICHAQPPSEDWHDAVFPDERAIQIMLWARTWIESGDEDPVASIGKTFHGHTPKNEPVVLGNTHFIDTGAVFTGKLTVVKLSRGINDCQCVDEYLQPLNQCDECPR